MMNSPSYRSRHPRGKNLSALIDEIVEAESTT